MTPAQAAENVISQGIKNICLLQCKVCKNITNVSANPPCLFLAAGLLESTMCYDYFCSILLPGPTVEKDFKQ